MSRLLWTPAPNSQRSKKSINPAAPHSGTVPAKLSYEPEQKRLRIRSQMHEEDRHPMNWLSESYMCRRAVARGREGTTHLLNKAVQGEYHYVYGPYAKPVLRIAPGDIVVAETEDAFGGAIKTEKDMPSQKLRMPFVNPQCGPIAVEGAEPGDVLCVHIKSILPRGPQPVGTSALIPEFGGLVSNGQTAMLNPPLPERVMKYEITEAGVKFNDRITLPYEPFIGTLGVSPLIEAAVFLQLD